MEREERFDSFYRATRAQLLHQAFVLTGDLPAATSAVRDAYVAAWQHWRKVSRLEDPLTWVRPRAWDHAQRRHTARIWHRNKGMPEDHKAALDIVAKLPYVQRRLLLLTALAGVPLPEAARELGLTPQVAERHLQSATTAFAAQLGVDGVDSALVRAPLLSLDDELRNATLPRASIVRRAGRKRRRSHGLAVVVSAVAVSLAAGAVAYQPHAPRTESLHLLTPRSAGKASVADATETLPTAA
ncbi:MAG: sigma factor-like helix-turn-helix DNA-binding protein, partial [Nocardioidaceae bacterium]